MWIKNLKNEVLRNELLDYGIGYTVDVTIKTVNGNVELRYIKTSEKEYEVMEYGVCV